MDLKEIKKIITFAKHSGIKSLTLDGLSVEFHESVSAQPRRRRISKLPDTQAPLSPPDVGPTLQKIYDHIYSDQDGM